LKKNENYTSNDLFLPLKNEKYNLMAGKLTFSMIKPEAVADGHSGSILKHIEAAGFRVRALKLTQLTPERAGEFYVVHKDRPFYGQLKEVMTEGPIIALVLEKENAVLDFRTLIGATNPANAAEGTIRKLYAKSLESNAVHGSDSDENALLEASFFFSALEQY
jgi:nucleoside-diphosphate kinase